MTGRDKKKKAESGSPSMSFNMEAERSGGGMSLIIGGIIGVVGFSEKEILLLSHGGRIGVFGIRLQMSVFDGNSVEIAGHIERIEFKYGKD